MITLIKTGIGIILGIMAIEDWKEKQVRNIYLSILCLLCVAGELMIWKTSGFDRLAFMEGISAGILLLGISFLSKNQIGKADGFVILFLGILFGMDIWFIFMLATTVMFVIACYLWKKNRKNESIPFVPAITFGYFVFWIIRGAGLC